MLRWVLTSIATVVGASWVWAWWQRRLDPTCDVCGKRVGNWRCWNCGTAPYPPEVYVPGDY